MTTKHSLILFSLVVFLFSLLPASVLAQQAAQAPQTPTDKPNPEASSTPCPDVEPLRKNITQLNIELQRLKKRVAELEKERLANSIQEQLEKEEQRGEALQLHLLEITQKEEPIQTRLDQINQQLRPETIERTMAGVGSLHPENLRDDVKTRLNTEKTRLLTQLELLRQDRTRTRSSLATTDAAIQRLRIKLSEALRH